MIHAWVANPKAGETYEARAWIRVATGSPSPTSTAINLREANAEGTYGAGSNSGGAAATDGWEMIVVSHTMTGDFDSLEIYVAGCGDVVDDCFLVDDIELHRRP
jgi:hypothetical protein